MQFKLTLFVFSFLFLGISNNALSQIYIGLENSGTSTPINEYGIKNTIVAHEERTSYNGRFFLGFGFLSTENWHLGGETAFHYHSPTIFNRNTYSLKVRSKATDVMLAMHYDFYKNWYALAKSGMVYRRHQLTFSLLEDELTTKSIFGVNYPETKLGIGYKFNNKLGVQMGANHIFKTNSKVDSSTYLSLSGVYFL